jgi:hypothetical protein
MVDVASRLGLGCARLRAGIEFRESQRIIEAALKVGINYFDTAPMYGEGRSEGILGTTLKGLGESIQICSKAGFRRPNPNLYKSALRAMAKRFAGPVVKLLPSKAVYSENIHGEFQAEDVRRSVIESLGFLERNYLDYLLLHEPRITDPDEAIRNLLRELKDSGLVRHIGVGTGGGASSLPRYGEVTQCVYEPNALKSFGGGRSLVVHGVLRKFSNVSFVDYMARDRVNRIIRDLGIDRMFIARYPGAFLLSLVAVSLPDARILISTQRHQRLMETVTRMQQLYEPLLRHKNQTDTDLSTELLKLYYGVEHRPEATNRSD